MIWAASDVVVADLNVESVCVVIKWMVKDLQEFLKQVLLLIRKTLVNDMYLQVCKEAC